MDEKKVERAREKVKSIKKFYTDLWSYIGVNVLLIVVNLVTSPHDLWFYWVTVFWGIALVFHAIKVFGKGHFDEGWEERKVKEILENEEKEGGDK